MFIHEQKGFTLIELLVTISIFALLSSIVFTTVSIARLRSRDAVRFSDYEQIQRALELYHSEYSQYPPRNGAQQTNSPDCGNDGWDQLAADLRSYLDPLPTDPLGCDQNSYLYFYDADSGNGFQTYGFMMRLESPNNFMLGDEDNGYYAGLDGTYYELGEQPSYCFVGAGYSDNERNWWGSDLANCAPGTCVCRGGN